LSGKEVMVTRELFFAVQSPIHEFLSINSRVLQWRHEDCRRSTKCPWFL